MSHQKTAAIDPVSFRLSDNAFRKAAGKASAKQAIPDR
jgi:hypothetical protein